MKKILELDLGTNSIGWAVIDQDSNKVLNCGTKISPLVKRRHQSARSSCVSPSSKREVLLYYGYAFAFVILH